MSTISTVRTLAFASAFAIGALATAAHAAPEDRWFNLTNESGWAIQAVYVANVDNPNWGPNLLRGATLDPFDYVVLDPVKTQGYCEFDILVVFSDGDAMEMQGVDLCRYIDIYTDGYDYELVAI
jgi:hypothetical protein